MSEALENFVDEVFSEPAVWVAAAIAFGQRPIFHQLTAVSRRFTEGEHFAPEQHGTAVVQGWITTLKTLGTESPGRESHQAYKVQPELFYLVGTALTVLAVRDHETTLAAEGRAISQEQRDSLLLAFNWAMLRNDCDSLVRDVPWRVHESRVDAALQEFAPTPDQAKWFWDHVVGRLPDTEHVAPKVMDAFHRLTPSHVALTYASAYHLHRRDRS